MSSSFKREHVSLILALLAVGLMSLSAFLFRPRPALNPATLDAVVFVQAVYEITLPDDSTGLGFWVMIAGGLALYGALRLRPQPAPPAPTPPPAPVPLRWRILLGGIGLLWLAGESSAHVFGIPLFADVPSWIQFAFFAGGVLLVARGLGGQRVRHTYKTNRALWLLVGVFLLALALRLWQLHLTLRVLVDEMHFMASIIEFWARDDVELMRSINTLSPFAKLYTLWQTWAVALLGPNFLGFRVISALIGALNVLAVYFLARTLFDRKTGLLAALMLAVFPPHLHFSRLALIQIGDPFFATLAFAFLARSFQRGRSSDYALAGVTLGLTQYFYEGGRLLFPVITLIWLGCVLVFGRPLITRRSLVTLAAAALLTAFPLYYTIFTTPDPMTGRLTASGLPGDYWVGLLLSEPGEGFLEGQINHIATSFLMFVHMPERALYYGGYQPLVLSYLVPVFLLGVWYTVWRGGARGAVVLLWVSFTALGSSLLVQNAVASRYVVVLPALALLLGVGFRALLRLGAGYARIQRGVLALTLLAAAAQGIYYFAEHIPTFDLQFRKARLYHDVEDALLRALPLPPETRVHLILSGPFDEGYNRAFLRFFSETLTVDSLDTTEFTRVYLARLDAKQDHAFFIEPDDLDTLRLLQTRFTLGAPQFSPYHDVPADEQLALFFIPRVDYSATP